MVSALVSSAAHREVGAVSWKKVMVLLGVVIRLKLSLIGPAITFPTWAREASVELAWAIGINRA